MQLHRHGFKVMLCSLLLLMVALSAKAQTAHYGGEDAGYYYYNDRPQTKFTLKMIENEPNPKGFNKVVLNEYSPKGNHTGTFKGIIEGRGDGFYGTFTNGQGKKFEFNLMQQY